MPNYREDILDIDLASGRINRTLMNKSIGAADDRANRFGVRVYRNGVAEYLSGTCLGLFIRRDGSTVVISDENGVIDGNVAYVTLPAACYAVEGNFILAIKVVTESTSTTLRIVDGCVNRTSTTPIVDPGTIIPSIEDLIAEMEYVKSTIPEDYSDLSNGALIYRRTLNGSDDLDDLLDPGIYYVWNTESGYKPVNYPSHTVGNVIVSATTAQNSAGTAQYVLDSTSQLYVRYKLSAGFSDWRKVLDNGDILTDILPVVLPLTLSLKSTPTTAYDLNNLTSPGMYSIGDVSLASNYPSTTTGRLIVFGDPNSSTNRIVQMVMDNNYNVYMRYISAAPQRWIRLATEALGTITATENCNDYTRNGQFIVTSAEAENWASDKTGKLIVFGDENNANNRIIQMAIDYQANVFVRYKSSGWSAWRSLTSTDAVKVVTVKASGGDYTTIPAAVKYVTDQFSVNADQRWLIKIDPGTYDIADEVVTMIGNSEINSQGLFINPHVTICGAGKDKTIIRFLYEGSSDSIMSNVSLFNMPYESALLDCTLICKNIRYCIHSALNASGYSTKYIDDVNIRCANVKMEHLGFDDGKNPTYYSPGCFGSGSTNGGKKEFYNCDFIAKYTPWFNHNRKQLTKATELIFEGCAFVNRVESSSVNLITWIDDPQIYVTFRHCFINRYMAFTIRTDSYGTADAHNGYYVTSDGDLIVLEPTTNNVHLEDNYMDANCQKLIASESITAYQPVSKNDLTGVRNYVNTDAEHGIALCSASSGDIVTAKFGGHVLLSMITSSTFAVGKRIGWNGSAWVEDNDHPIIEVVYSGIGRIV